mmetsp:Transcript_159502/g.290969  ORF Transcript_159502/g.290969 Transcript_159502/m.290969 type:complete len:863 (+) Transcript_159502:57-2645(+)
MAVAQETGTLGDAGQTVWLGADETWRIGQVTTKSSSNAADDDRLTIFSGPKATPRCCSPYRTPLRDRTPKILPTSYGIPPGASIGSVKIVPTEYGVPCGKTGASTPSTDSCQDGLDYATPPTPREAAGDQQLGHWPSYGDLLNSIDAPTPPSPDMRGSLSLSMGSVDMGETQFGSGVQSECPAFDFLSAKIVDHCAGEDSDPFMLRTRDTTTDVASPWSSVEPTPTASSNLNKERTLSPKMEATINPNMGGVSITEPELKACVQCEFPGSDFVSAKIVDSFAGTMDVTVDMTSEFNKYECPTCGFLTPDFNVAATHCTAGNPKSIANTDTATNPVTDAALEDALADGTQEGDDFALDKYECPVCGFLTPNFDVAANHCAAGKAKSAVSSKHLAADVASPAVHEAAQDTGFNKYKCPKCDFLTPDFDLAANHCAVGIDAAADMTNLGSSETPQADCTQEIEDFDLDKYECPVCGFLTPNFEVAAAHCANNVYRNGAVKSTSGTAHMTNCKVRVLPPKTESSDSTQDSNNVDFDKYECPMCGVLTPDSNSGVTYRCPTCNVLVPSLDAAISHCSDDPLAKKAAATPTYSAAPTELPELPGAGSVSPQSPSSEVSTPHTAGAMPMENSSEPTLMRQYDPKTGRHKTVVRNLNGTTKAFGCNTVTSLVENSEGEALMWMSSLTDVEVKGLLSEVSDHVSEEGLNYMSKLTEVESLRLSASYAYFGLSEDATEKDVDNAYRQLAKRMHPDKNGGTEDAKQKFQDMKSHYEALKGCRSTEKPGEGQPQEVELTGKENLAPEDSQQGEQDKQGEQGHVNLPDLLVSNDRGDLEQAVMIMRAQLRTIRQNMDLLSKELESLSSVIRAREA